MLFFETNRAGHVVSRKSSATAENIKELTVRLRETQINLEERLLCINDKLDLLGESMATSESEIDEVKAVREERLSTEECLQICADLSKHISDIQLRPTISTINDSPVINAPVQITSSSLKEWKENIGRTTQQLEDIHKGLVMNAFKKSKSFLGSVEQREQLAVLQDECEAIWKSRELCQTLLDKNISTIENRGTGDLFQMMASTDGTIIHGKNEGYGRIRQGGGHYDKDSFKAMLQSFAGTTTGTCELQVEVSGNESSVVLGMKPDTESDANFAQYGKGVKLSSQPKSGVSSTAGAPTQPCSNKH